MSRKFGAQRRGAFLRALAETGNQTLAAARAKVSRSWVTLHRAEDAGFREACEAAVAEARERLRTEAESTRAPAKWGAEGGAALVVRGTRGLRVQIAQARVKQWDPSAEERFLATLMTTCNVRAACAAAGLSAPSAYNHRHRWPSFASRWDAALKEGAIRLEAALLENGGNIFSGLELPEGHPMPPMTVQDGLMLLSMHWKREHGYGRRPGRQRRVRTLDEVRASLLRKINAIAAASELKDGAIEDSRQAWDAIGRG